MCSRKRVGLVHALLACAALLALLAAGGPAAAAPAPPDVELAAPLAPPIAENGGAGFQLSPDGRFAIYQAQDDYARGPFYVVPTDGSAAPRRLGDATSPYQMVLGVSAERALIAVAQENPWRWSLISVPLAGARPSTVILGDLPAAVSSPVAFVDGGRVVFQAQRQSGDTTQLQLLSAPVDGSSPPLVLVSLGLGETFSWEVPQNDRGRVFYALSSQQQGVGGLFVVPVAGPAAARTRLSPAGVAPSWFRLSPDGGTVAFPADDQVYIAPGDGSAPARVVSPPLAERQLLSSIELTPDGATAAFVIVSPDPADNFFGLAHIYSAPADGSAPAVRLSSAPVRVYVVYGIYVRLAMSPDSSRVAWTDTATPGVLIATLGAAESAVRLPTPAYAFRFLDAQRILTTGPAVAVVTLDPAIAATPLTPPEIEMRSEPTLAGERVMYIGCLAPCAQADGFALMSVPLAGPASATVRLATWYRDSWGAQFAPAAGGRVVYAADSDERPGTELYSVPVAPIGAGFAARAAVVEEGQPGRLEVRLERAASGPVRVEYRVDGLGATRRGALSFAPGALSQTIDLGLAADGRFTGDRLVRVALVATEGAAPGLYDRVSVVVRDAEATRTWLPQLARGFD